MNCGMKLPEGAKFCLECGAKVSVLETSSKATGGAMDDSVAIRSPGAGSVYAPSVTFGTEKEKRYCDICKNEITGRREFAPCTRCGKLMCNVCGDNFKLRAGNIEIPEALREDYFEPLCWECWNEVKAVINRVEEERLKKEKEQQERLAKWGNSIGMKFTMIPAGKFNMGSEKDDREKPVHKVKINNPFYLGTYPVTQAEWEEVMGENPSKFKGDDLPVEQVSWDDVREFIKKFNEKEGTNKYRLPSEAEWEYACRAGTHTRYSFGDYESKLGDYAWYDANSGGKAQPVGQKQPNSLGLYDMHGNVWEWVQDNWHNDYNGAPTDGSAWESGYGADRLVRGGSWLGFAWYCRSAFRGPIDPRNRGPRRRVNNLGFRILREL
jgi:formylglycine-generating enzyme required for sulfatase activity